MIAVARLTLGIVVVAATLGGCRVGDDYCTVRPFPSASPVAMGVAGPGIEQPRAAQVGACPGWVEYGGRRYTDTRTNRGYYDAWTLKDADLNPIGLATGATPAVPPLRDDRVFRIEAVEPGDAIAMYSASGAIVVLTSDRQYFPASVCRYLKERPLEAGLCPSPSQSSSPR